MKKSRSLAFALLGFGFVLLLVNLASADSMVRDTQYGKILGIMEPKQGGFSWLGIPFAKPPVGNLRWQPPQEPDPWKGVLKTQQHGNACTQIGGMFGPPPEGKDYSAIAETFYKPIGSEDCLYMNIWRPKSQENNLPVVVWIHGGSNVVGASYDALYNGNNLANSVNAVVVTVAYRLGLMGWFYHPALNTGDSLRDSGNFALLDLIQGLKFVKNNIANFGGDPGNVTIMGQSAGSTNVNALIVSPLAAGLFQKAIPISGGLGGSSTTSALNKANDIINALLIKDKLATDKASAIAYQTTQGPVWTKNYLMSKTNYDLYNIQVDPKGGKWGTGSRTFAPGSTTSTLWGTVAPILDGTVQPSNATAAVQTGNFNKVPQLVGNTAEEGKLFSGVFKVDDYTRIGWMNGTYLGTAPTNLTLGDVIDASPFNLKGIQLTKDTYNAYIYNNPSGIVPGPSITTFAFWYLANASLALYAPWVPLYAYDFKWNKEPAPWNDVYGAWHTEDLPFIFGNFGLNLNCFGWTKTNEPGRLALSHAMQQSVSAFIRTGDPNNGILGVTWVPWTTATMHRMGFDATNDSAIISQE
jgi:para-nitrobenzyl esterase